MSRLGWRADTQAFPRLDSLCVSFRFRRLHVRWMLFPDRMQLCRSAARARYMGEGKYQFAKRGVARDAEQQGTSSKQGPEDIRYVMGASVKASRTIMSCCQALSGGRCGPNSIRARLVLSFSVAGYGACGHLAERKRRAPGRPLKVRGNNEKRRRPCDGIRLVCTARTS